MEEEEPSDPTIGQLSQIGQSWISQLAQWIPHFFAAKKDKQACLDKDVGLQQKTKHQLQLRDVYSVWPIEGWMTNRPIMGVREDPIRRLSPSP